MDDKEKEIRQRLKDDFIHYASKCLKIRVKKGGEPQPFNVNRAQIHLHTEIEKQKKETGKVRIIGLKGRQQGFSTYVGGRYYHKVTHRNGVRAFIMTHLQDATKNLFEMTQRFHDNCHPSLRPTAHNKSVAELYFGDLDSGYKVGTAGNKTLGRSGTIQYLHGSEVAFWPNASEHANGIIQSVPDSENTEIILESTACGLGNYFHEQWQLAIRGESEFKPVFVPWYWQDEYTKPSPDRIDCSDEEQELSTIYGLSAGQILWRRSKIIELSTGGQDGERSFKQEYPFTPAEAFQFTGSDPFFTPELVMRVRKCKADAYGALIVGVDPARFGNDKTAVIRRQGRVAFNLEQYHGKDTMQVAGLIVKIIKDENPNKVFIDVGGLGAGVVDRLIEMGFSDIIEAVNSGEKALDEDRYVNRRSEMYGELKKWMLEMPCSIPDEDELHAELCAPKYDHDSKQRLSIETKKKMKKRGIKSPNASDALCLTFAAPVSTSRQEKAPRNAGSFMGW